MQDTPELNEVESFTLSTDKANWITKAIETHTDGSQLKTLTREQAKRELENPLLLATTLVTTGYVDCGVAGSLASTAEVLKACLYGIGPSSDLVSSVFLIDHPYRLMTYGDCAVNPKPSSEQLARIAIDSAATHEALTGDAPKVALLSFSTKGFSVTR